MLDLPVLEAVHGIARSAPGWESRLREEWSLSDEEMRYIAALEANANGSDQLIREWEKEIERDGGLDLSDAETPEEKLSLVGMKLAAIEQEYADMHTAGTGYLERAIFLELANYERLKKIRGRLTAAKWHKAGRTSDITESDIERARQVPLEAVIEVPRTKMVRCVFHVDKSPSMWVANGFGWCFSCGAWTDSIKYLMHVDGFSFVDAVKSLRNR